MAIQGNVRGVSIQKKTVAAVRLGELLDDMSLSIPHYQRPYSWRPVTAVQLLEDLDEAQAEHHRSQVQVPYVLGTVILHAEKGQHDVVDGQQRLLTLKMILMLLSGSMGNFAHGDSPVTSVWVALRERLEGRDAENRAALAEFIRNHCQVVKVITDDLDEAFRIFDSQNSRGKALAPHDLLKAHHLREMRQEAPAMKAAVVHAWESVRDEDLERLFSRYLYRIRKWSRGERAGRFSTADIGMFKGITGAEGPAARYHQAAQAALPVLNEWGGTADDRNGQRAQFQLDHPPLAGRHFFEMVEFMLEELNFTVSEGFDRCGGDDCLGDGCPGCRSRFAIYDLQALASESQLSPAPYRGWYRLVGEIYIAALLYFISRFGTDHLIQARERLFRWAYSLRVRSLRVTHQSMNRLGTGADGDSAFRMLREADSWRVINHLETGQLTPPDEDHAQNLRAFFAAGEQK